MANNSLGLKLKPMSVRIAFIAFALFLLFAALASFGVVDLTASNLLVLKVAATLIIFTEVGFAAAFKSRGKSVDFLGLIGIVAGILILATLVLEFFTLVPVVLAGIQGVVFGVLVVTFFIEAFR